MVSAVRRRPAAAAARAARRRRRPRAARSSGRRAASRWPPFVESEQFEVDDGAQHACRIVVANAHRQQDAAGAGRVAREGRRPLGRGVWRRERVVRENGDRSPRLPRSRMHLDDGAERLRPKSLQRQTISHSEPPWEESRSGSSSVPSGVDATCHGNGEAAGRPFLHPWVARSVVEAATPAPSRRHRIENGSEEGLRPGPDGLAHLPASIQVPPKIRDSPAL